MALTVSHIQASFLHDTKTIGKQSAYLDFEFGGRTHSTDVLKSAGKFATWETPVQLTGAGVHMKIIAKATKTLGADKPLGIAEVNLLEVANKGQQTVRLTGELTNQLAGEVTFQVTGGSPAISGLPHTAGTHSGGALGAVATHLPGHHDQNKAGSGVATSTATTSSTPVTSQPAAYGQNNGAQHYSSNQQPHETPTQRLEDRVLPGNPGAVQAQNTGGVHGGGQIPHQGGSSCPHCEGSGSMTQRMEQGLGLGGQPQAGAQHGFAQQGVARQ